MRKAITTLSVFALLQSTTAHAYIGPGIAAGTFATILGILSAIFFAFVGILWYPIKRLFKGNRKYTGPAKQPHEEMKDSGVDSQ
jgi:hypothetical protein